MLSKQLCQLLGNHHFTIAFVTFNIQLALYSIHNILVSSKWKTSPKKFTVRSDMSMGSGIFIAVITSVLNFNFKCPFNIFSHIKVVYAKSFDFSLFSFEIWEYGYYVQ